MRSRILVAAALVGAIGLGTLGARASARQWAVVELQQPTEIGPAVAIGPVLFVHDDAKMARGEPCTTVYRYDAVKGPQEAIVSFHCQPRQTGTTETFILTTAPAAAPGSALCRLRSYQFAGDSEAHGVPSVP